MEDLSDFRHTILSCNRCGQCKWILGPKMRGWDFAEICPIHQRYNFDSYSGQGLLNIAQELLDGVLSYEPGLVDLVYSCTTCGACDINCKYVRDMEVLDTILALRARMVADGVAPPAQLKAQSRAVSEQHNIYGLPPNDRFRWFSRQGELTPGAPTVYFVGCATAYRHTQIARDVVGILAARGVEFDVLGPDEHCCGGVLWRAGDVSAFREVAVRNLEILRSRGVKTIITACAECYGTFRGGYPRVEPMDDIDVVHVSQVIAKLLDDGKLEFRQLQPITVTYHDPCLLGRLSEKYVPWQGTIGPYGLHTPPKTWRRGGGGVYEPPRRVLASVPGVTLVEMVRNQECSYCCGAGGGVAATHPELARWIARERLREAQASGAEAIVTCCPFCEESLRQANLLPCWDLTELVAQAVGIGDQRNEA